jgi:hypothetical protein
MTDKKRNLQEMALDYANDMTVFRACKQRQERANSNAEYILSHVF